MYKRIILNCSWKNEKLLGALIGFLIMSVAVAGVSMFTAVKVMATPEMEVPAAGEQISRQQDNRTEPGTVTGEISGNDVPSAPKEKGPGTPVIVVDAGHGGEDEGCARDGVREKDINLSIALLLREELLDMGYHVVLSRDNDTYIAKETRAAMANAFRADAFVSIHQNASEETGANGIETWYYGEDTTRDSRRLAALIMKETLESTGAAEREIRDDAQLYVTGNTLMPACLIETGFLSNAAERGQLSRVEYQEKIAAGIARGIDLYFHPKTMYLTFDDGPSAENTGAILDTLKARSIKATFFVIGEYVRKNPEVARRIVAEGHTIGIHCNRHDYEQLYQSADSYVRDFEEARRAVLEVTGVEAELFRFPGGSVNAYNGAVYQEIIEEMTKRGFIYFDWNASLEDAVKKSSPQELIENAVNSTLGRKKVVMLAHDVKCNTALCLDELLDALPDYEMKPLTAGVKPVQFKK